MSINISGMLVHALPQHADQVRQSLLNLPGVEVHLVKPDGRLVVTVEECPGVCMADSLVHVHNVEGVLSASLVYQHFEEDPEVLEESPCK